MNKLSPLTRDGLKLTALITDLRGVPLESKHPGPASVIAWECGVCGDLHRWEDDAHDCCAPDELQGGSHEDAAAQCPVCGNAAASHRDAADCCLWHDLDAPTRWRIADAVEACDLTWAEAIARETEPA